MALNCVKYPVARMNKRLAIQSVAQASDSQGGYTDTWSTDASVWASIEPVKGYEKFQAQQLETPITHKVVMRYRSGVTTKNRLLYGSRIFHIKEVINENEQNAFLTLTVQEMEA